MCRHVFQKDKLINYYWQGLNTAGREILAQQVQQISAEDRQILSVIIKVATAVGSSQRAPMSARKRGENDSRIDNYKAERSSKTVLITPPAPIIGGRSTLVMKDPSDTVEVTYITDMVFDHR